MLGSAAALMRGPVERQAARWAAWLVLEDERMPQPVLLVGRWTLTAARCSAGLAPGAKMFSLMSNTEQKAERMHTSARAAAAWMSGGAVVRVR